MTAVYARIVVPVVTRPPSISIFFVQVRPFKKEKKNFDLDVQKVTRIPLTLTHEAQDLGCREHHILLDIRVLHDLAIDFGHKSQFSSLLENLGADQDGTDGSKLVKGLRVEKLASVLGWELEDSTREVIADGVAENTRFRLLYRDVATFF